MIIHSLLALMLLSAPLSFADQVRTLRITTSRGSVELCTAVSISSRHAVALCVFDPDSPVAVELDSGTAAPDSMIVSPDLGLVIMVFYDEVFEDFQIPSSGIPEIGERILIAGQGVSGTLFLEGRAREQYPDGSFLVSSNLRDGLMGAAAFNSSGDFVGLITGTVRPRMQLQEKDERDYLVLYPSQIWYMWAQLIVLGMDVPDRRFGVTALSSISLTSCRSSGIQIVSIANGSRAWEAGLRPGDLITHIDGTPVYHPETLRGLLILSDDTLTATVQRGDFIREISIPPFE